MSSPRQSACARRVWFDQANLWVSLTDGRVLSIPLDRFARLLHATSEQRNNLVISGDGTGLHWEQIDEDINVAALLMDKHASTA